MVKADSVREVSCSNGSFRNRSDDPSHHVTPIICSNIFLKVAYSVVVIPNTVSGSFYMCNENGHFNNIYYQAGIQYNALTWLLWVSTESWLRVFSIIHLFCGCLVLLTKLAFSIII